MKSFSRSHLKDLKKIVLKVGSGLLTHERGLNTTFFSRLAREVALLKQEGREVTLVSSGAIASGMQALGLTERPKELTRKQAVAALGQPLLMKEYARVLKKQDLHGAQMLLTRADLEDHDRWLMARHTVREILKMGLIPIINENDSVTVEEIRFGDNDQLSALVAELVGANLLIIMTDIDGLYDADPKKYTEAQRISCVPQITPEIMGLAGDTRSAKSTGGMITKLKAASLATQKGIATLIVDGKNPKILQSLFQGIDCGTLFLK